MKPQIPSPSPRGINSAATTLSKDAEGSGESLRKKTAGRTKQINEKARLPVMATTRSTDGMHAEPRIVNPTRVARMGTQAHWEQTVEVENWRWAASSTIWKMGVIWREYARVRERERR